MNWLGALTFTWSFQSSPSSHFAPRRSCCEVLEKLPGLSLHEILIDFGEQLPEVAQRTVEGERIHRFAV